MKDREWFQIEVDERQIKKERAKARELKQSQWWKNLIAKGICHYCEGKFPPAELTMDHVVPIARGGLSSKGNIVPACKKCNAGKKLSTPAEDLLRNLNSNSGASDSGNNEDPND